MPVSLEQPMGATMCVSVLVLPPTQHANSWCEGGIYNLVSLQTHMNLKQNFMHQWQTNHTLVYQAAIGDNLYSMYCSLQYVIFTSCIMLLKGVFIWKVAWWWKMTLRSSQDSNLGPLKSCQMLLPMSYWSFGIGAEDRWHLSTDTVQFSGWISTPFNIRV